MRNWELFHYYVTLTQLLEFEIHIHHKKVIKPSLNWNLKLASMIVVFLWHRSYGRINPVYQLILAPIVICSIYFRLHYSRNAIVQEELDQTMEYLAKQTRSTLHQRPFQAKPDSCMYGQAENFFLVKQMV